MEIVGLDTDCSWNGSVERLRLMLMAIRLWWPQAVIEEDKQGVLFPPLSLNCELFVYSNGLVRKLVEEEGVVPAVESQFIHVLIRPNYITFVTGQEKCEGWRLAQDLILTIYANKLG